MRRCDFQAKRTVQLESLESRHLMAGDLSVAEPSPASQQVIEGTLEVQMVAEIQNTGPVVVQYDSADINRDRETTALDALMVINFLNRQSRIGGEQTSGGINGEALNGLVDSPYDVNGDGQVSAVDALWVINVINQADSLYPLRGCSCGGVGCPACSAATGQWFVDSPVEPIEGSEAVESGYGFPSGGCSCGGLGCAACSGSVS